MEFIGKIKEVLPARVGKRQDGSGWNALPFVFEYKENESDRTPDSVVLEDFDTNHHPYIKEGLEVKIGFGHKAKQITRQDGTTAVINEMRMYKIESIKRQQAVQQAQQGAFVQQPLQAPQQQQEPVSGDDLPF